MIIRRTVFVMRPLVLTRSVAQYGMVSNYVQEYMQMQITYILANVLHYRLGKFNSAAVPCSDCVVMREWLI